ncbi:hypothetical protein C3766_16955 [Heyndrickxia coagulans]|nr:hypothetical protein C3766_16955 [Heyndrickxia coagulans]
MLTPTILHEKSTQSQGKPKENPEAGRKDPAPRFTGPSCSIFLPVLTRICFYATLEADQPSVRKKRDKTPA